VALAAVLSVQSPFTREKNADPGALEKRMELNSDHGDAFTVFNAFLFWLQEKIDSQVFVY
jgi:hypothetical protein